MKRVDYEIPLYEEKSLLEDLESRKGIEAARMKRYLAMPDLSRTPGNPLNEMIAKVTSLPTLKEFDHIKIPEIISSKIIFDLFNFAPDHPARSKSDTYYVTDEHVLRTHDTVFWYYYLNLPEVKEKIARGESLGTMCYGKVYRKDEIDRRHMNTFHQMGAWFLQPDSEGMMKLDDLKNVLSEIVKTVFGNVEYRFLDDTFPYTDPSLQVEVKIGNEWVEILGGGMPRKNVLKDFGIVGYNGWAFGFGLERLAIISMELPDIRLLWSDDERVKKQLKLGQKFVEVSKYPPIVRDISFVVQNDFIPNDYFDFVREIAPGLIEQVELLDKYENIEKFGIDKISYSYRVTYRSLDRTLTAEEIEKIHKKLEVDTKENFAATIR